MENYQYCLLETKLEEMSVKPKSIGNNVKVKPPSKKLNAKPSAAVVAAKKEASQRKKLMGQRTHSTSVQDIYQKAIDTKEMIRQKTGLVYDRFMAEHRCLWDEKYPECPERILKTLERCEELGLLKSCQIIESQQVDEKDLLLKHTSGHINILKSTNGCSDVESLERLSSKYDAVYFHPTTYQAALLAVGSTINLIKNICQKNVQNGMAIIRPPGHHAMKSEFCGYCFLNNVAIAAEIALKNNWASKILIVDWDVHHGQATQQMFYNDSRVVYFSIHRYENGQFWPNLKESNFNYVGEGCGEGYNFNVPLNKTGMTNADYLAIFHQVLLPMAYEFQPDLIIVSAGYDAALGCPEGEMNITPACYAHLLSSLLGLANGRVAVVLEGGYCIKSLAESAALTLRTLLGYPCPILQNLNPPCKSIQESILNVIYTHRPYWNCYKFQDTYSINKSTNNSNSKRKEHMPIICFKGPESNLEVYETRNCYPVQSKSELRRIEGQLNQLVSLTNLNVAPNRVCVAYDERMLKHHNVVDGSHPEKPSRISSIYSKIKDFGLLDRCMKLEGRIAVEEEILLAHSKEYLSSIKATGATKLKDLTKQASGLNSVYLHPETWSSACVSVGTLLQVVDNVLGNISQSGLAIVRPPGHHALEEEACGFCIFNNVSIAAKYAVKFFNLKRVLIVDWDIHHGNGTQSILENDPRILYISLHRYDNGTFFPHSTAANYTEVGTGPGKGFNVNIPWNKKGVGDAEYAAAFFQVVMPIAYQFNPELVLISAGFDACVADPLGGCKVTPEMYGHMTHWLSSLANGRVILTLEGGYNINSISHAMTMCAKALLGDPLSMLEANQKLCPSAVSSIMNVLSTQKDYWPNLVFQRSLPEESILPKAKVPRSKPTERSDSYESLVKKERKSNCTPGNNNLCEPKNENSNGNDEELSELNICLQDMKINKCANPGNEDQCSRKSAGGSSATSDGKVDDNAAAGSSGLGVPRTSLNDYFKDNLQALVDGEMFAVVPLRDCPHLGSVNKVPDSGIDVKIPCQECKSGLENWICLTCYSIHCARSINQHAVEHEQSTTHPLALSFSDLSVWCYRCESYIDNPRLYEARNAVHNSKFNEDLPWTYDDFEN